LKRMKEIGYTKEEAIKLVESIVKEMK
ncbi:hypothetical protein Q604_UNBC13312G0001, partial [human gut metagenome]